jgi:hypothetical protein
MTMRLSALDSILNPMAEPAFRTTRFRLFPSGRIIRAIFLTLYLAIGNAPLYAWNDLGHMVTAWTAYQHLTDSARARANALIKQNPFFEEWKKLIPVGTSDKDRDRMLFMIAATFADQIKSDPCYQDDGAPGSNGNHPEGRPSSLNVGYADHLRHKYWHFVDKPFSQDGTTHFPEIPIPNAQTQIKVFRGVLAANATEADDDLKSYDLVWLLHLVGDVHQPLHASTRVSSTATEGDGGGNKEKVYPVPPTPGSEKLHQFWDRALDQEDLSDNLAAALAKALVVGPTLPKADSTSAQKLKTKDWTEESFADARSKVYVSPIGEGDGPFQLTDAYCKAAQQEARQRIALAGARLANVLNNELK